MKLVSSTGGRVRWRLSHAGKTVAHGVADARDGDTVLRLSDLGDLAPGRYVLHVAGRRGVAFVVG